MPAVFQITLKVFLIQAGQLLVLRDNKNDQGDLPGGRLDTGEIYQPFSESIKREIQEELGPTIKYKLKQEEPLFIFPHFIDESGYEALGLAFEADFISGDILLSDEHNHLQWIDLQKLKPEQYFTAHLKDAVQQYLDLQ